MPQPAYTHRAGVHTHTFRDLKDLMAKATPARSGDALAGVAAQTAQEHPHATSTGLGIGLSLARTLAELRGGSVTLQSEGLGHGSTFTVVLPCRPHRVDA